MNKSKTIKIIGILITTMLLLMALQPTIATNNKQEKQTQNTEQKNQPNKQTNQQTQQQNNDNKNTNQQTNTPKTPTKNNNQKNPPPQPLTPQPELHATPNTFHIQNHKDHGYYNPLYANQTINLNFSIINTGTTNATNIPIDFYLSTNNYIDITDHKLNTDNYIINSLNFSEQKNLTKQLQLPPKNNQTWTGNAYYHIGIVIDPNNIITEQNENNNSNTQEYTDYQKIYIENTTTNINLTDLDADTDNNQDRNYPERTAYEEQTETQYPGKYIILNEDDDDKNRQIDKTQDGAIIQENELVPILLQITVNNLGEHQQQPVEPKSSGKGLGDNEKDDENATIIIPDYLNYTFKALADPPEDIGNWDEYIRIWKQPTRGEINTQDEIIEGKEYEIQVWRLGDMDHDHDLDSVDSTLFNDALTDTKKMDKYWTKNYPNAQYTYTQVGDMNIDGILNNDDYTLFNQSKDNNITRYVPLPHWIEGQIPSDTRYSTINIIAYIDIDGDKNYETPEEEDIIRARISDCGIDTEKWYGIPPGYQPNETNPYPRDHRYVLRAGGADIMQHTDQPSGYPLNLAMGQGFGPADFPPKNTDPILSTSPLVSKPVQHFQGMTPYQERTVHNDIIDTITGQPLLQETDFTLPFGDAVFRHIRTYSENYLDHMSNRKESGDTTGKAIRAGADDAKTSFWDWNGMFWMMSENPILLLDARYEEIGDYETGDVNTSYCYFIPDAHHTIPFEYNVTGNGQYIPPDWYDAILLHNGNTTSKPTEYNLWLHDNSIKYTFTPYYEGVEFQNRGTISNQIWIDAHDPMPNQNDPNDYPDEPGEGWGFPFYALVTQIEDRYGNTVEYEYHDEIIQWECDNATTEECIEVCQNINQKGQLRNIKLRNAQGNVVWTILYVHREFSSKYDKFFTEDFIYHSGYYPKYIEPCFNQNMVHGIYIYNYDVNTTTLKNLTLSYKHFKYLTSFDDYDSVDAVNILNLPNNWTQKVEYLYEESDPNLYYDQQDGIPDPKTPYFNYSRIENADLTGDLAWNKWNHAGYNLLKTTNTHKTNQTGQNTTTSARTIYRYEHYKPSQYDSIAVSNGDRFLEAIFNDNVINLIKDAKTTELGYNVTGNILFELPDDNNTVLNDPETPEDENKTLIELADIVITRWDDGEPNIFNFDALEGIPDPTDSLFVNLTYFIDAEINKTEITVAGVKTITDRRMQSPRGGNYSYYILKTYPIGPPIEDMYDWIQSSGGEFHTEYHYPYRYRHWTETEEIYELESAPWDKPFFNIVIDEHNDSYDPLEGKGMFSRRVIKMNPSGFVLEDSIWVMINGTLTLDNRTGYSEHLEYDQYGRVIERRTNGWSCQENQENDPENNGLIYTYTWYPRQDVTECSCRLSPPTCYTFPRLGHLETVSIKKGTNINQDEYVLRYYERNIENYLNLWNKSVAFPNPVELDVLIQGGEVNQTILQQHGYVTEKQYVIDQSPCGGGILNTTTIKPEVKSTQDGETVRAADFEIKNENGNVIWHGYGNIDENNNSAEHFFLDYKEYDDMGRITREITDINLTSGWINPPNGLNRNSTTTPLNYTTYYRYDDTYGLIWKQYPNGREEHYVYKEEYDDGKEYLYQWTYKDVIFVDENNWTTAAPVQITCMENLQPIWTKKVTLNNTDDDGPNANENYTVISISYPSFDSSGRMTDWLLEIYNPTLPGRGKGPGDDDDSSSVSAHVSYHATGEVRRSEEAEGTITRYLYNGWGYLERTYQGTSDVHPVWRNANPEEPETWDDNMILIEKRYYGDGTTNAGKPIEIRHYRDKPINQYFEVDEGDNPVHGINNEENIGWTTETKYDWRMRPVLNIDKDIDGMPIRHTFVWFDNLDHIVLKGTYGETSGCPAGVDPRYLLPGWNLTQDNITALLTADTLPLSLTQTVFNSRGKTEEYRVYDVQSGEDADFISTYTYYDHEGRQIEVISSNEPVERSVYDARGREVQHITYATGVAEVVGDLEIFRVDSIFDADGNNLETVMWERVHNNTEENQLDSDNGIITYNYNWYNLSGDIIATASYGTNNDSGLYCNGEKPAYTTNPPEGSTDSMYVTFYGYDDMGNQNMTQYPDGTITHVEFNGMDKKLLVTENSDDRDDDGLLRHTAYKYDNKTGQLMYMAAVLPSHDGLDENPGLNGWADIDWDAPDKTLQVTGFTYGADVIAQDDDVLTFDGSRDYVQIDEDLTDDLTHYFTVAGWFKCDDTKKEQSIIDMGRDLPVSGWRIYVEDDELCFSAVDIYDNQANASTEYSDIKGWHHVAVVYEFYGHPKLYLDGVLVDEAEDYLYQPDYKYNEKLTFGGMAYDPTQKCFMGQMEKISVYNEVLFSREVEELYEETYDDSSPLGCWMMNETQGLVVYDSSGNQYDGMVYDAVWMGRVISQHNNWIKKVSYPEKDTGQPSDVDTLRFRYYNDGSVATRTDARNNTIYYRYDELGRVDTTLIYDTYYYDPEGNGEYSFACVNRTSMLVYNYSADGLLLSLTSYSNMSDNQSIISENMYVYDGLQNLVGEYQQHFNNVSLGVSPMVEYEYMLSSADDGDNYNRLCRIIYPNQDSSGRNITLYYGDELDDVDDVLCRVTGIYDSELEEVVNYTYMGLGRRVRTVYGNDVSQQLYGVGDSGYSCLDQFGRTRDLHYKNSSDGTVHRYQYGYDYGGNKVYMRTTQSDGHDNDRSFLYKYDALNRLINSSMGRLDAGNENIIVSPSVNLAVNMSWTLDNLGNWAGGNNVSGSMNRYVDNDHDGVWDNVYTMHHTVDSGNQIQNVNVSVDSVHESDDYVYDLCGNIVSDGDLFYQYDGLGRLMQINDLGGLLFDKNGMITGGQPGDLLVCYVYDGFGRLIHSEKDESQKIFYYDGSRRIQEVNGSSLWKEYVYGPDYFDEYVLQTNESGDGFYMLQDLGYNVMAVLDDQGDVLVQYVYEPYGELSIVDELVVGRSVGNLVGHQGLFFDCFDGDCEDQVLGMVGLYYNRNRWYNPVIGRFIQRDPYETGMPLMTALVMNGQVLSAGVGMFDALGHYGDGLNLYGYARSNPLRFSDPSGLITLASLLGGAVINSIMFGLVGAAVGGAMSYMQNGDPWGGAIAGFAIGSFGMMAFASGAGFIASAMVGGFFGGMAYSDYTNVDDGSIKHIERMLTDGIGWAIMAGISAFALQTLIGSMGLSIGIAAAGSGPHLRHPTWQIAQRIGKRSFFGKHEAEWNKIGITNYRDCQNYIHQVMTRYRGSPRYNPAHSDGWKWYDPITGIGILYDPLNPHRGTAFLMSLVRYIEE